MPIGKPGLFWKISASFRLESGTCSLGLRMNALPPTRACGSIHSGTMNGKLNGADAGHDAQRARSADLAADAAADLSWSPLGEVRQGAAVLDALDALEHLGLGLGS